MNAVTCNTDGVVVVQLGVFIRYTRRADDEAKDQNLPVVWLPESTSLKEALQRGSSLAGWAGLARKTDGRLGVRSHAPRDSHKLIEARRALLPASTLPPSPFLGVVGKYWLRGVRECDLAVLDGLLSLFVVSRDPFVRRRLQLLQMSHFQSGYFASMDAPSSLSELKQMPNSGKISGRLHPATRNSVNRWRNRHDSRATLSELSVGEDETVAPLLSN